MLPRAMDEQGQVDGGKMRQAPSATSITGIEGSALKNNI